MWRGDTSAPSVMLRMSPRSKSRETSALMRWSSGMAVPIPTQVQAANLLPIEPGWGDHPVAGHGHIPPATDALDHSERGLFDLERELARLTHRTTRFGSRS